MVLIQAGFCLSHIWRQPQTGKIAIFMNPVSLVLHAAWKFVLICFQPVPNIRLPAIINLEQIALFQNRIAAGKIILDCIRIDILIAVVPGGVAIQLCCCPAGNAKLLEPAVKHFLLAAGCLEKIQHMIAAIHRDTADIPLHGQNLLVGIIDESCIARILIQ